MSTAPAPTPAGPVDGAQGEAAEGQAPAGGAPAADPAQTTEATGQDGIEVLTGEPTESLPGVMDDGPIEATKRPEGERVRDEKGRFVAAQPSPEAPEAAPAPEAPEAPVDPNAPVEFEFAGRKYKTQAEAEQRHKSLEGQFKPLSETAAKAAESAHAWKAEAENAAAQRDALFAELQAVKAIPQSQPAEPSPEVAESAAPEGIDWELYAEISKRYTEAGEPYKAQQWLQEKVDAIQAAREAKLREALEAPAKAEAARRQLHTQTAELFSSLAEYANDDGTPAYPELRDKEAAFAVGRFWQQMGLPASHARTPQGAIAAIALYRMAAEQQARSQGSPDPVAPPTPEDPAAAAAASLVGGRPPVAVSPADSSMDPVAARLLKGLAETTLTRPGLGFEE